MNDLNVQEYPAAVSLLPVSLLPDLPFLFTDRGVRNVQKRKRLTNGHDHEFYSERFLTSRLASLVFYYLVYIRPFCQLPPPTQDGDSDYAHLFLLQLSKASCAAVLITSILRAATVKV